MFTVKLCKGHNMKLVEASEVRIHPCGRTEGSDDNPNLRTNKVREIEIETPDGRHFAFYITEGDADSHAPMIETWSAAYIENSRGATTETVRPY